MDSDQCVFCAIVRRQAPASVVEESDHTLAFLDVNPITRGHTLVVPRRHVADLYDLTPDESAVVLQAAVRVARRLREALEPEGLNFFHATGAAALQTVFHVHVHVLPRWRDDGLRLAFDPLPTSRQDLDALAAVLRGRAGR